MGSNSSPTTSDHHISYRFSENEPISSVPAAQVLTSGHQRLKSEIINGRAPDFNRSSTHLNNSSLEPIVPRKNISHEFQDGSHQESSHNGDTSGESHFERCRRIFDTGEGSATRKQAIAQDSVYSDNYVRCNSNGTDTVNVVSIELESTKTTIASKIFVPSAVTSHTESFVNSEHSNSLLIPEENDQSNTKQSKQQRSYTDQGLHGNTEKTTVDVKGEYSEEQKNFKKNPLHETKLTSPSKVRECLELNDFRHNQNETGDERANKNYTLVAEEPSANHTKENNSTTDAGREKSREDTNDVYDLNTSQNSSSGYSTLEDAKVPQLSHDDDDSDSFSGEAFKLRKNPKFENYRSPRGKRSRRGGLVSKGQGNADRLQTVSDVSVRPKVRRSQQLPKTTIRDDVDCTKKLEPLSFNSLIQNGSISPTEDIAKKQSDNSWFKTAYSQTKSTLPSVLEEPPCACPTSNNKSSSKSAPKTFHFQPSDTNDERPLVKISALGHLHEEKPGCCILSACSQVNSLGKKNCCGWNALGNSAGGECSSQLGLIKDSCRCFDTLARAVTPPLILSYPTGTWYTQPIVPIHILCV